FPFMFFSITSLYILSIILQPSTTSPLFPYTTLFRSEYYFRPILHSECPLQNLIALGSSPKHSSMLHALPLQVIYHNASLTQQVNQQSQVLHSSQSTPFHVRIAL